jgi:hypothetical protein
VGLSGLLVYALWLSAMGGRSSDLVTTPGLANAGQLSPPTLDPTQPTITVSILGQKQVIPLPPGAPNVPPGEEQVVNCHYSLPSGLGGPGVLAPGQDPRCPATSDTVVVGAISAGQTIEDLLARLGVTTTTVP